MPHTMEAAPEGYRLGKQLYASAHSVVHEAVRADGTEVVLKAYHTDRVTDAAPRARRELEMLRRVAGEGVPRALDLDLTTERPLLVLERLSGLSLARILDDGPLDLETWLRVGIQVTETLARIHAARVLHKDLTPANLLLDRAREHAWICDFGLAQELGAAQRTRESLATAWDTLRYISPEQTGRMNRGCDFRSDLYSLGATLYHALIGHPPFAGSDKLYLVHAHLARIPDPPAAVRPGIPLVLSRILLKLLCKEPLERYQSARALLADLTVCRDQLARSGAIADFPLGSAEARECPRFAPRLYGRQAEVELLERVYGDAAAGRTRSLWITGEPGVGKSTLVDQLRPLLVQTSGYLAIGKFDLYAERPYAAWISALTSLVQQILMESDARLERWRSDLRSALGSIAPALVDLVPDLAFVLGDVAPAARLDPREAQARLSLALQRFVSACATTEHPLVLFLDDLQWSDVASRTLLRELLASPSRALLVIGAHRVRHESAGLDAFLADLPEKSAPEFLRLEELTPDAAAAMLADALGRSRADVTDLAELVERRAGTSPLLVRDFVEHVHATGLLRYQESVGWTWDPARIATVELPDGTLALLAGRLDRLPQHARTVLQFASCVGDEFDLELLCELGGFERLAVWEALCTLADAAMIAPCANGFRFAHDRIRESAQQRLSTEERSQIHLETARLLLERLAEPAQSPRALEIVEHLKRIPEIPDEIRLPALRASCTAGGAALLVGAVAAASEAFALARRLLRDDDRAAQPSLVFEVHMQSAETAYQIGEFEAALGMLDALDPAGFSLLDAARVEGKRIRILAMCRDVETCVRYTLAVLRRLGVRWPLHPSKLRAQLALAWVTWLLRKRPHPDILQPAKSFPPRTVAALLVLQASGAILSRIDVHLAVLAACLSMQRQVKHGYFAPPAFGIAVYAAYLHLFLGRRTAAERFAETALAWTERMPDPLAARSEVLVDVVLRPYLMRRRQAFARVEHIVESARENGDLEYAYYARFISACYLALAGDEVGATAKGLAAIAASVQGSELWYAETERSAQIYGLLDLPYIAPADIERAYRADLAKPEVVGLGQGFSGTLWLLVLCTFGRHELAFAQSQRLWKELFRITPFIHVVDHVFYRGIAAAALADSVRGRVCRRYRSELRRSLRYVKARARDGPDFAHMVLLLEAERARLARHFARARTLYDEAATRASRQKFPHHAALAHERHVLLLAALRRDAEADVVLRRAVASYREWGALGKAALLAQSRGPQSAA